MIFEENKPLVLEALGNGNFDYMESASEVFETEFFRHIKAKTIFDKLSEIYPTPRKKEDVPMWFYVASNLSMRLHDVHSFNGLWLVHAPYAVSFAYKSRPTFSHRCPFSV